MPKEIQLGGKKWWFESDELVWQDISTGTRRHTIIRHPTYESLRGLAVRDMHLAPDRDGLIILLQPAPQRYRTVGNLLRVNLDGEIEWWAELTDTGTDNYTVLDVRDQIIAAYSWNGFNCQFDPKTGRIVRKEWVK